MIGFLGYADVGGMHVKNIAYVFVVTAIYSLCCMPVVPLGKELNCDYQLTYGILTLFPGVFDFALALAIVDKHVAQGSVEETTALMA